MSEQDLTSEQLKLLIQSLKSGRQTLLDKLENSESSAKPVTLDQQSVGRVSRIDAIQQQQMAVANRQQDNQLLKLINNSLDRVDRQEYGYCLECGESIGFARLQVQPQAAFCVSCQEKLERN